MRSLLASSGIIVGVLLLSCGGPAVRHTSIDGFVREVQNWSIVWKHDPVHTEQRADVVGLESYRSRYSLPEACQAYVGKVKQALINKHGFSFYDNVPAEGTLELLLYGQKVVPLGVSRTDAAKLTDELSERRSPDLPRQTAIQGTDMPMGDEDIVRRVEVSILDVRGKVLGQIFIGDDSASKITPEHVANAVAKAIKTGGLVSE